MELNIHRGANRKTCCISMLFVDNALQKQCYILEDLVREVEGEPVERWKVQNKTAIPRGRYKVLPQFSPHFGRMMPHLQDVPGYTHVMIHPGNTDIDTDGCLLTGTAISDDGEAVTQARIAYEALLHLMQEAWDKDEEVWVTLQ
jgi:hypothetical protein